MPADIAGGFGRQAKEQLWAADAALLSFLPNFYLQVCPPPQKKNTSLRTHARPRQHIRTPRKYMHAHTQGTMREGTHPCINMRFFLEDGNYGYRIVHL